MSKNDRKAVPLPGLHDRYVNKGIKELEKRHYAEAEKLFKQALELEEGDKAHFGMLMSLYQLGRLREVRDYCEALLEKEMKSKHDHYIYLQMYATVLKELEEYERGIEQLKTSLQKQYVPEGEEAEKCHQWLRFFLRKVEEEEEINSYESPSITEIIGEIDESSKMRSNGALDAEWHNEATRDYYRKEIDRIKETLQDQEGDPYIKSMILQDLKLNQFDVTVPVYKFGKEILVDIEKMKDVTDDGLYVAVKEALTEKLESDNPTLYQMALQLWDHFMTTMFPVAITPQDPRVWGAAVYQSVHIMNGMEADTRETAQIFDIFSAELANAVKQIEAAEQATSI